MDDKRTLKLPHEITLFQCGQCKNVFVNIESYNLHKAECDAEQKRIVSVMIELEKGLTMARAAYIALLKIQQKRMGIQSAYPVQRVENEVIAGVFETKT